MTAMHLKKISIRQFRNLSSCEIDLNPHFNFIHGRNAQGKTSIIEAIYYLANLKSFRTSTQDELIKQDSAGLSIEAVLKREDLSDEIKIQLQNGKRELWLNGKKPKLLQDYYGLMPVILFEPWEVYLFRESPSQRRKFTDRCVFLENPAILKTMRDYENVVTQRNRLLRERAYSPQDPFSQVWDEKLLTLAAILLRARGQYIRRLQDILTEEYQRISQTSKIFTISYQSTNLQAEDLLKEESEIFSILKDSMSRRQDEELRRQETLIGPHRDDWIAQLDGRELGSYGSQGENRCGVIALKSSQIRLFIEKTGQPPLFLLDDIASELDSQRAAGLFEYLQKTPGQVFITTTEPLANDPLRGALTKENFSSFFVEEGSVRVLG